MTTDVQAELASILTMRSHVMAMLDHPDHEHRKDEVMAGLDAAVRVIEGAENIAARLELERRLGS